MNSFITIVELRKEIQALKAALVLKEAELKKMEVKEDKRQMLLEFKNDK